MVPVSGDTKTESSTKYLNTEPIHFILDNKVDYGNGDTLLNIINKGAIDTIQHVNEIIENNTLIGNFLLIPQGDHGEVISAQVKSCSDQYDWYQ